MQLSPLTGHGIDAVPIEDTIRGVAVLLDFDQQIAGTEGVKTSCRQKCGVTGFCSNLMDVIGHCSIAQGVFELLARDLVMKSQKQFGARIGLGNVPEFCFWFAAQSGGGSFRWVHLQRKFLVRIEKFDEQRKARRGGNIAENRLSLLRPQFMQGFAFKRTA